MQSTRAKSSAEDGWEACYAEHHALVFHLGMRFGLGNRAWAEDLTHDVFVKFAENAERLHSHDDIGGWLRRVTCNLAISRLRREKSFFGRVSRLLRAEPASAQESAEERALHGESIGRALEALGALPPKERVVLSMKLLDECSQREISETLNLSPGYVSKLLRRGLSRLREEGWETP